MQNHNVQEVKDNFSFQPPNLRNAHRQVRSHLQLAWNWDNREHQCFPRTLSILVGGLSSFEFVEVWQEWADLQGKANWELRVTVRQAGTAPAGYSLTESEQEQSSSGGASQGQPQPLDKSAVMRQARGQARKLIQQVRGRDSEVQGPTEHPYSARKCRSQDRTLKVHEWRLLAALSLNLAVFVELSSKVMQHHHIRADLTRSIMYSVKMKETLMILFPHCRKGEVMVSFVF